VPNRTVIDAYTRRSVSFKSSVVNYLRWDDDFTLTAADAPFSVGLWF